MSEVKLWTLPVCSQCTQTKNWLDQKGIKYTTEDISLPENAGMLQHFKENVFPGEALSAPIVEVTSEEVNWHTWFGFDREQLEEVFGR